MDYSLHHILLVILMRMLLLCKMRDMSLFKILLSGLSGSRKQVPRLLIASINRKLLIHLLQPGRFQTDP